MSEYVDTTDNFESDEIITLHLNITGRVQGVGYRDSLRMIAQALNVTGWVRNIEDGSVQALVQGEEQDVERVVARMARERGMLTVAVVTKPFHLIPGDRC